MTLKNLQYSISVADISGRSCLLINQQESCVYSYKNISFYKGNVTDEAAEQSDYVIIMADTLDTAFEQMCDAIFVVVDNSYAMSVYLKEVIRSIAEITGIIFREVTDNGVNSEYIIKYVIKDDYLYKLMQNNCVYQIADDVIDREYKISMGYEGITHFKNLSGDFLRVISAIAVKVTGKDMKMVDKALGKAKEGEIIEHSILE